MTEKHKLNVPETMTEVLDVSDEEGMIKNRCNIFAIIMFLLKACIPKQIALIITDMTCHVAVKQAADGALSDDSFDEGTRHYSISASAWLLCRITRFWDKCVQ